MVLMWNVDSWGLMILVVWCMMDVMWVFFELIIVLFLIFVFGFSLVLVMIVVVIYMVGVFGKLFFEVNENIDCKLIEGLSVCGVNWLQWI